MINYVFRPKRMIRGRKQTARLYSGRYKLDGEARITEVPLKTTDKQVAKKLLNDLVRERERERAGIIPPKNLRDAAAQTMEKHLVDFLDDLRSGGRDDVYVENLGYLIRILIRECKWFNPSKVTADSFKEWRSRQKKASKTLNEYLDCANAILNWMIRKERIERNPLVGVEKINFVPAFVRRAFTENEISRLITVAGPSRVGYLLAVHAGLRRGELKALRWEHIHFNEETPVVILDGQFTKNGKDTEIPLHPELAQELRACKPADAKSSDCVLTGKMLPSMWKMKRDLKKAGIEYEDDKGRRADFHSLRHTLATNLARRNIPPRVAMEIMRHSDIRLTMNRYTDASLLPMADAIAKMPNFGATDVAKRDTQIHTQTPDVTRLQPSPSGTPPPELESSKVVYPQEFWRNQSRPDTDEKNCLARIRT
jgi:integrase